MNRLRTVLSGGFFVSDVLMSDRKMLKYIIAITSSYIDLEGDTSFTVPSLDNSYVITLVAIKAYDRAF
jgi:hypothetical protein